jgi:hypothetical protein
VGCTACSTDAVQGSRTCAESKRKRRPQSARHASAFAKRSPRLERRRLAAPQPREHAFVQSPGSAHAQFRRSLDRGNLTSAFSAARDLPTVSLEDALALCLLIRDKERERFGPAAARWAARWASEIPGVDLAEAQLVQAALVSIASADGRVGALALLALVRERQLRSVEKVLHRWLETAR